MTNWFILRTRPAFELKLETAVQQIGIAAYVPKLTQKRRHPFDKREVITVRKAIYPGYVFSPDHFHVEQVNTTTLKASWMRDGEKIAQLSDVAVQLAEQGERYGYAIEEVIEALRMGPLTRKLVKRAPYSRDLKATLGRAA